MTAGTATAEGQGQAVPWWAVLLEGIVALIIGIFLLTTPREAITFLVFLLGIYWLISGIFSIVSIFVDSSQWGWKLFLGILGIIAGIIVIQHPLWSSILIPTLTAIIIGIFGIIMGIIGIIQAFQGAGWGVGILGVLSILFGIVGGILAIIAAFQMK